MQVEKVSPPEKNPMPPSFLFLLKPVSLTKILSSSHANICVVREADDYDNEEAAHLPPQMGQPRHRGQLERQHLGGNCADVRGKQSTTKSKEHKHTCKRCTHESRRSVSQ